MPKCIYCGKEFKEDDVDAEFCSYCGAPLKNKCSNYSCASELENDACFCKYCGAPSIFYNGGLLTTEKVFKPKNAISLIDGDELPFN